MDIQDYKELYESIYNRKFIQFARTPISMQINTNIDISEEQHIDYTFTKMLVTIQDLYLNNYKNIDNDDLIYTGFNFNVITQKCIKQSNENIPIPIYIQIMYAVNYKEYTSLVDKEDSPDKIIIYINSWKIEDDCSLLFGALHHEFLHLREMYAKSDVNILKSFKNRIPDIDEENVFKNLKPELFDIIKSICYIFKQSEQRARINGVYQYIMTLDNGKLSDIYEKSKNKSEAINNILDLAKDVSSLELMSTYIEKVDLYSYTNNLFAEAIIYYGKKYGIITKGLQNYHFNYKMFYNNGYDEKLKYITDRAYTELSMRYNKFKQDCQDAVYKALKDKKII